MNECAWTTDGRQCAHSDNKINQLFDQWSAATDLSSPEICTWDKFQLLMIRKGHVPNTWHG